MTTELFHQLLTALLTGEQRIRSFHGSYRTIYGCLSRVCCVRNLTATACDLRKAYYRSSAAQPGAAAGARKRAAGRRVGHRQSGDRET